jgi:predicted esterase
MNEISQAGDPHAGQPVSHAGEPLDSAQAAVIMIHGRGASARDILTLMPEIGTPEVAWIAPQASGNTWYPQSFLMPIEQNEPYLSSALATIGRVLESVEAAGIPAERTVLLGFSQGACLTSEFMARNARRFGGLVVFSGGLIGPEGTPRDYEGSLHGTPVFIGCSDVDAHIPVQRVEETSLVLNRLGAEVDARIYPGMGHTVNRDELEAARALIEDVVAGSELGS